MLPALLQPFQRFLQTGITAGMPGPEMRRLKLLNLFYLLSTFLFAASIIQTFLTDGMQQGIIISAMAVVFQGGLPLLLLRKTKATVYYFIIVANCALFYFQNNHGNAAGVFLYYFPFMLLIAFLADFKKNSDAIFQVVITLLFIVAGILFDHRLFFHAYNPENDHVSFIFNFFLAAMMNAVVTIVVANMQYRQYSDFNQRIEERRKAEEEMRTVIRQKETLLAEVHHRVKNNLAVISGLLNLQMNEVDNEYTRNILLESRNRVVSMALIHQKLYKKDNLEEIDFGEYIRELVDEITRSYQESLTQNIQVSIDAQAEHLRLATAIPCGLILNELLSNCYKHAFPEGVKGHIFIRFGKESRAGGHCYLEVEDDGIGRIETGIREDESHLGMTIISSLAQQIDGTFNIHPHQPKGTLARLAFPA